ncbi:hypothetical protein W97_01996 [Coniosporium apollinis CBS 100218]|uniref:C2H2-type domain-containing protein n=1 Tax=Coniosporium apollinis (strain CBS 100218) TaxID=1168221 RepID=R7YMA3_CONA1|nr:uncharacterized protein W97_01996 [Coniosporium apollinis CBS 100218]EON62771.1 hypothetical protein W97_01996 [Coniosporium apollinis CBS 100218]
MTIPNARESPPPPLPPPRHIGELNGIQGCAWQRGNGENGAGVGGSSVAKVKQGSSLLNGTGQVKRVNSEEHAEGDGAARHGTSLSTAKSSDVAMDSDSQERSDEERGSQSRPSLANYRLQSERQLGQRSLDHSSQAYDKQLLSKIGGPNTPTRIAGGNYLSTSAQETSTGSHNMVEKLNGQLKPLSMPERRFSSVDSPSTRWPSSGTVSPGNMGFRSPGYEQTPTDPALSRRFSTISSMGGFEESAPSTAISHRGSYDHAMFSEQDFPMEENAMRDLNISERSPSGSDEYQTTSKVGVKRRAPTPPTEAARDDRASGGNDLYHRRSAQMLNQRNLPVSRFHANHGSLSSTSSLGQRNGSYASSFGLSAASSATSYNGERISPSASSPSIDTEFGPASPYINNRSYELHELEKQYTCQYCPNRFKNKNEAERHQNSLHLRRHSWSCAALAGVHAAFHPSTLHPTAADVCGYCGEEFSNPANWEARAEHLDHVHKFGECNQAKKFFRADHFRQHLKHSHAGTSGKWTNMLENACMKNEPPPKERMSSVVAFVDASPGSNSPGNGMTPPGIPVAPMIAPPSTGTMEDVQNGS